MKQESVKHLADGATTLAVSSGASSYFGWFTFINENAPGIGVLLSFLFGSIGLIFYWLTWKKSTLAEENKKQISQQSLEIFQNNEKLDKHITETTGEFKSLSSKVESMSTGIDSILDKLS